VNGVVPPGEAGLPSAAPVRGSIAEPDHLVVAARTLDEGIAWCEATLGVRPEPGGRHAAMGTHNVVLALGARRYLEIIAIDPEAEALRPRWFDLDLPAVRRAIAASPRLVHWVARTPDIAAGIAVLRAAGHDVGAAFAAERPWPGGVLRWQISLTSDGHRPALGALPLLIEWGAAHPCDVLPGSGVTLERIAIGGVGAALAEALGVSDAGPDAPPLSAWLETPRGRVALVGV
jgi:hypothetical protein